MSAWARMGVSLGAGVISGCMVGLLAGWLWGALTAPGGALRGVALAVAVAGGAGLALWLLAAVRAPAARRAGAWTFPAGLILGVVVASLAVGPEMAALGGRR